MPSRQVLKSVLAGFLGTFVSRNSDSEGYWALGCAEPGLATWTANLLDGNSGAADSPSDRLRLLAATRFLEQVRKAGLPPESVVAAQLSVASVGELRRGYPGMYPRDGRDFAFRVVVKADTGRVFEAKASAFVAPHNAALELRRLPDQWGT